MPYDYGELCSAATYMSKAQAYQLSESHYEPTITITQTRSTQSPNRFSIFETRVKLPQVFDYKTTVLINNFWMKQQRLLCISLLV
jgi:hypothetical protein